MFAIFANSKEKSYICIQKNLRMDIIFKEEYLKVMYLTGQTDKKHRYQPQVIRKYIRGKVLPPSAT